MGVGGWSRPIVDVKAVPVPGSGETFHHRQGYGGAMVGSTFLRPEESDGASGLDHVPPPVPDRHGEVNEALRRVQPSVAEGESDRGIDVEPAGIDVGIDLNQLQHVRRQSTELPAHL